MKKRDRKAVEADETAFFDRLYGGRAYHPVGWRLRLEREVRSVRKAMGKSHLERVLSIGCGDGEFELLLAPFVGQVTALDISPQAIQIARRKAAEADVSNIDFRCQSLADLSWNSQFDAVLCVAFLHHVPESELPRFLRQVYEHLVPGGFLYAQDPNIRGVMRKIGRLVLGASYDKYHSPDERELDPQALKAELQTAGFSTVRTRHIDLTLTPALYLLTRGPGWPLRLCAALDWAWCHSPLAPWSSGFTAVARKD